MLWQAVSGLHANERPSKESHKDDKPNDQGIVHHRVPSADTAGLGMTRSGDAKGPAVREGLLHKLVSAWQSSIAALA